MRLPENKVKELIALMNSVSNGGIPPQPPILELFDLAMDEKTVDFLLAVGSEPKTLHQLEEIYTAMGGEDWPAFWQRVLTMSFLHPMNNTQRHLYQITPIFPGWVEFFTAGPRTPEREAVLNKFLEFWNSLRQLNKSPIREMLDGAVMKDIANGVPPKTTVRGVVEESRSIALSQPLQSVQQVLTAGDVYDLLSRHPEEIAIANCFCRQYKKINTDADCGQGIPLESCMAIGVIAKHLVENGTARYISYEEAVQKMAFFEDHGCIHTTFHNHNDAGDEAIAICDCCADCCLLYGGYRTANISKLYVRALHVPQMVDESNCVGCNKCGRACPTAATYYDREAKKLVFDYDRCIGCGQCVHQCPFEVRKMVPGRRDVFLKTLKPEEALA